MVTYNKAKETVMKSRFIWLGAGLCAAVVAACAVGDPAADTKPAPPRLAGAAAQAIITHARSDSRVLDSVSALKQSGWEDPDWANAIVEIKTAPNSSDSKAASLNVAMVPIQRANNGTIMRAHINFVEGDLSSEGVSIAGDDADSVAAVRADLESDVSTEPSASTALETPESPDAVTDIEADAQVTPDVHVNWCAWGCQAVGSAVCTPFGVLGSVICGTLSTGACSLVCRSRKPHVCPRSRTVIGHPCILWGKWVHIPTQGEVHTCNGYAC
jgi:hypothetical protein